MEKMREVADAYYKAGAEDIKRLARDFFNSMDLNGDRRVILREYLAFTEKRGFIRMSNQEWFRKLDKDKKGSLGFHDVMTLCYIVKSGRPFCKGCGEFMSDVFFTCVKCFDNSPSCFSVCFQCYESGNIEHQHKEFLDNFALLEIKRTKSQFPAMRATAAHAQILRKDSRYPDPMKELRQIAMAYCRTTSEDIKEKEKIRKFFSSMHYGNNERVALHEFLEFMRQKSYRQLVNNNLDLEFMNTPEFFRKLDKDKKGSLDFSDVKTLYYIIQSGRPFCKGCGEFIYGMFFTCVSCFERRGGATFSLCLYCYDGQKFVHNAAHHLFLDNYALLEAVRETAWKAKKPKTHVKANGLKQKSASLAMLLKVDSSEESASSPGPIVSLNNKPNFTTKANTSSLGSIVPVINKPSAAKAIASTANSLVKVIDKTTNAKDTFESFEAAMNMAIAAAMTVTGFSGVCVIL